MLAIRMIKEILFKMYLIDSDRRPVSNRRPLLKSASTDVIISNHSPFQIIRSMVDLLLSNRRPFQCQYMYVLIPCHVMDVGLVCISSAIAHYFKLQSSRHKFSVPDLRYVYKKAHQRPSYLSKFESKI